MNRQPFPRLQFTAYWADLTDHLVELVGCFPSDKLDWRPTSDEWSAKQIVLHIVAARDHWMAAAVGDGGPMPDISEAGKTTERLQEMLRAYDVHHRADILRYAGQLGIDSSSVRRRRPL